MVTDVYYKFTKVQEIFRADSSFNSSLVFASFRVCSSIWLLKRVESQGKKLFVTVTHSNCAGKTVVRNYSLDIVTMIWLYTER